MPPSNTLKLLLFVVVISGVPAFSQTAPIAEVANAVTVCSENPVCVITAISDPAAVVQFGSGTKWCQTVVASKLSLPVTVSYTTTAICAYDPMPFTSKTLAAVQKSTAYTVTYKLAGVAQTPKTIPALVVVAPPPPPPPPVSTVVNKWDCVFNEMSDGTFVSTQACTPVK